MLKVVAAVGHVAALFGGAYIYWHLSQPKNLRDAVSKVDTLSSEEGHFIDTWRLFKHDEEFMNWVIGARDLNLKSATHEKDAAKIIKEYCEEVLAFPYNETTVKDLLPRARTYCTVPKYTKKRVVIQNGSTWREITEAVKYEGIEQNAKIFLVATDYAKHGHGHRRQMFYCWNNNSKRWDIKKEGEFCS